MAGRLAIGSIRPVWKLKSRPWGADRARLADLLDKSEAKVTRLDAINRDVSHKLVEAMETIRSVLQTDTGGS